MARRPWLFSDAERTVFEEAHGDAVTLVWRRSGHCRWVVKTGGPLA